jgi:hypothetical protein
VLPLDVHEHDSGAVVAARAERLEKRDPGGSGRGAHGSTNTFSASMSSGIAVAGSRIGDSHHEGLVKLEPDPNP